MAKTKEMQASGVLIEVPISRPDDIDGPVLMHLDCRLKPDQRLALARIRTALVRRHATLADGRHVESLADAVRWMIDQVRAA